MKFTSEKAAKKNFERLKKGTLKIKNFKNLGIFLILKSLWIDSEILTQKKIKL